jgi:hypothetical protein
MHSRDAKIVNLVGQHLETKEKTRIREKGYEQGVEKKNEKWEEEGVPPLKYVFFLGKMEIIYIYIKEVLQLLFSYSRKTIYMNIFF